MFGSPDKKPLLAAWLEQGLIGGGQMERLPQGGEPDAKKKR
jgi:hypothetical protein